MRNRLSVYDIENTALNGKTARYRAPMRARPRPTTFSPSETRRPSEMRNARLLTRTATSPANAGHGAERTRTIAG